MIEFEDLDFDALRAFYGDDPITIEALRSKIATKEEIEQGMTEILFNKLSMQITTEALLAVFPEGKEDAQLEGLMRAIYQQDKTSCIRIAFDVELIQLATMVNHLDRTNPDKIRVLAEELPYIEAGEGTQDQSGDFILLPNLANAIVFGRPQSEIQDPEQILTTLKKVLPCLDPSRAATITKLISNIVLANWKDMFMTDVEFKAFQQEIKRMPLLLEVDKLTSLSAEDELPNAERERIRALAEAIPYDSESEDEARSLNELARHILFHATPLGSPDTPSVITLLNKTLSCLDDERAKELLSIYKRNRPELFKTQGELDAYMEMCKHTEREYALLLEAFIQPEETEPEASYFDVEEFLKGPYTNAVPPSAKDDDLDIQPFSEESEDASESELSNLIAQGEELLADLQAILDEAAYEPRQEAEEVAGTKDAQAKQARTTSDTVQEAIDEVPPLVSDKKRALAEIGQILSQDTDFEPSEPKEAPREKAEAKEIPKDQQVEKDDIKDEIREEAERLVEKKQLLERRRALLAEIESLGLGADRESDVAAPPADTPSTVEPEEVDEDDEDQYIILASGKKAQDADGEEADVVLKADAAAPKPKTEPQKTEKYNYFKDLDGDLEKYYNKRHSHRWSYHFLFGLIQCFSFFFPSLALTKERQTKLDATNTLRTILDEKTNPNEVAFEDHELSALQEGELGKIVTKHGGLQKIRTDAGERWREGHPTEAEQRSVQPPGAGS